MSNLVWFYVISCGNDLTYSHLERSERSRRFSAVILRFARFLANARNDKKTIKNPYHKF